MIELLDKNVEKLLNEQVNKEFYSAYLYLDMANYYADKSLDGFANWFRIQAQEERDHAMLFITYMQNNGGAVTLDAIAAPDKVFSEIIQPLEAALEHEQFITASINEIYHAASEIKDYRSLQFLDWFIKEQGEEEKNSEDLVKRFGLFGNDAKGLYMLDSEMAARVYAAPSLVL